MNNKLIITTSVILALTLNAGCSSSSAVDAHSKHVEKQQAKKVAVLQKTVSDSPDWYLNPPKATSSGVYGVGMSKSHNIQFSKSKATLQAEFDLAKKHGQELSGQERSYMADSGEAGRVRSDNSLVIDKLVESQDISGYDIVDSKTIVIGDKITTYVLLYLPYDDINRMKAGKQSLANKKEASAAYQDLTDRLNKKNLERKLEKAEQRAHEVNLLEAEARINQAMYSSEKPEEPKEKN